MFNRLSLFVLVLFFTIKVTAQNTLPAFYLDDLGKGRIRIAWINQYGESCVQVSIQRSYDSVKNFRTILSALSPGLPQNGFIDTDPAGPYSYYRIFYVLNGGAYYFTKAYRAGTISNTPSVQPATDANAIISITLHDSIIAQLLQPAFNRFKDSITNQTRDTLLFLSPTQAMLRQYVSSGAWVPSQYIFTDRDGYVDINVPNAKLYNYSIRFFDNNDKEIFTIRHLDYPQLILDKANFIHSGWFTFEITENGRLKERNKFYLSKEF